MKDSRTYDRLTNWIRWLARGVGSFLALSFLYLGITTGPSPPSLEELAVVFTLLVGVLIAWRREGLGGLILILTAVVLFLIMSVVVTTKYPDQWISLLLLFVVPYLVPGILFLICWWRSRKSGMRLSNV
jgi:hypothetical protein